MSNTESQKRRRDTSSSSSSSKTTLGAAVAHGMRARAAATTTKEHHEEEGGTLATMVTRREPKISTNSLEATIASSTEAMEDSSSNMVGSSATKGQALVRTEEAQPAHLRKQAETSRSTPRIMAFNQHNRSLKTKEPLEDTAKAKHEEAKQ